MMWGCWGEREIKTSPSFTDREVTLNFKLYFNDSNPLMVLKSIYLGS